MAHAVPAFFVSEQTPSLRQRNVSQSGGAAIRHLALTFIYAF